MSESEIKALRKEQEKLTGEIRLLRKELKAGVTTVLQCIDAVAAAAGVTITTAGDADAGDGAKAN